MTVYMHDRPMSDDHVAFAIDIQTVINRHLPLVSCDDVIALLAQYIGVLQKVTQHAPDELNALVSVNICKGRDS